MARREVGYIGKSIWRIGMTAEDNQNELPGDDEDGAEKGLEDGLKRLPLTPCDDPRSGECRKTRKIDVIFLDFPQHQIHWFQMNPQQLLTLVAL